MNGRKLYMAQAMVFAALLCAALPAHAGGFFFSLATTHETSLVTPGVTVMADYYTPENEFKGSWGSGDTKAPNIENGYKLGFLFGATVMQTARPGDYLYTRRNADAHLARYGVTYEWYKPARDGKIPYRYAATRDSDEFNAEHRIVKIDPADGNSAAVAWMVPGTAPSWGTYNLGSNMKSVWARIVNGARDASIIHAGAQISDVNHDDAWFEYKLVFTVYPRCAATVAPTYVPEPSQPRYEQPAPQMVPMAPPATPMPDGRCAVLDGNIRALAEQLARLQVQTAQAVNGLGANDAKLKDAILVIQTNIAALGAELAKLRTETAKSVDGANASQSAIVANQAAIVERLNAVTAQVTEMARFLGELKAWHDQVAAPRVPVDVKPAVPCAPWDAKYCGRKLVIFANEDGVIVKVCFGRNYKPAAPYTMTKGETVNIGITPSLKATVETGDGEVARTYGSNGEITTR